MKEFIIISELILALAAIVVFLRIRNFLKKHENEKMSDHRETFRKMVYQLMLVGVAIFSLGAVYLVAGL